MNKTDNWYKIENIDELDTPALAIYPTRIKENIKTLLSIQPDASLLRPHIKTSKIKEIAVMLVAAGITRFKCATIAEAAMLAMAGATDILLAYQPTLPKTQRLLQLKKEYPAVIFACLIDNEASAKSISALAIKNNTVLFAWIDLNIGMNRTGIVPAKANSLYEICEKLKGITVNGLHAYDGHINDTEVKLREQRCEAGFKSVLELLSQLRKKNTALQIVAGGTGSFPIYAKKPGVQTSPGTFIFWDYGYQNVFPDLPFICAALVITRVISKPAGNKICLDLGYKSVAAEMPLPRLYFINEPKAIQIAQSEEHLVVEVADADKHDIGDVWYGIPVHICPSVALYESVAVIEQHIFTGRWKVIARDRFL
jgi:D-threonine aldolase